MRIHQAMTQSAALVRCARWVLLLVVLLVLGVPLLALAETVSTPAATTPPRAALPYRATLIREARVVWGLAAPVPVLAAQIQQESGWNPRARSPYAAGLTQFTPATADWMDDAFPELGAADVFNPQWAIRAQVRYDHWLYQRVTGLDDCQRWAFTLSAYNGGLGWVQRDVKRAAGLGLDARIWFGVVEQVNAGRAAWAFKENRGYPRRILVALQPTYAAWGPAVICEGTLP